MSSHRLEMKLWVGSIFCLSCLAFSANPISAQVVADDTLSLEERSQVSGDRNSQIEGGARRGSNLFHSFSQFSIPTDGSASFNNAGDIRNIFSRVTGSSASNIDGIIRANGTANLFLLNPNGILFGRNARLDMGGSFVATTADRLTFSDGFEFSVANPQTTELLTVSVPVGLQYGSSPGQIRLQGTQLEVNAGQRLALLGGNVHLNQSDLIATGGRIELGGLAAPGTVALRVNNVGNPIRFRFPADVPRSDVTLANGTEVEVRAAGSGSIAIHADAIEMRDGGRLWTGIRQDSGAVGATAGDIEIDATGTVTLKEVSLMVNSIGTGAVGNAGDIHIRANSLRLLSGSQLFAGTFGDGDAGNVSIAAADRVVIGGVGNIGDTTVASGAYSSVAAGASGNGGNIVIETGTLLLRGGAGLFASTEDQGNAGSVAIAAQDQVVLQGTNSVGRPSGAYSSVAAGASGNGGDITIDTRLLTIAEGAGLYALTEGRGNAGNVAIAADRISLDGFNQNGGASGAYSSVVENATGNGGNIDVQTEIFSLTRGGGLFANTEGNGNAGNINVIAGTIALSGVSARFGFSSGLFTNAGATATGAGGDITITAETLSLNDGAVLSARTFNAARGGTLTVNSRQVALSNGGQLLTTAAAGGRAGDIVVDAATIAMGGSDQTFIDRLAEFAEQVSPASPASGLFANTAPNATGQGGSIQIATEQLTMQNRGTVTVNSRGTGAAGSITAQADTIRLEEATISADTFAGQGNVNLRAGGLVLRRGSAITTNAGNAAIGGNIAIDTELLVAAENSDIRADSVNARGGNVAIETIGLFGSEFRPQLTDFSDITATGADSTLRGTVQINVEEISPNQGLIKLPTELFDSTRLIAQGCPADQGSSFVVSGRGGLPPTPQQTDDDLRWRDWRSPSETSAAGAAELLHSSELAPSPAADIAEATGWSLGTQGEVILTAAAPAIAPAIAPATAPAIAPAPLLECDRS